MHLNLLFNFNIFSDAKDMEQLTKNNITHILSIHDNAQPVLEVLIVNCNTLDINNNYYFFIHSSIILHYTKLTYICYKIKIYNGWRS